MRRTSRKVHLINLYKWRSIVALIACLITIFLSLNSVAYGILTEVSIESVRKEFQWFTVDSNLLTTFAALMVLPYAVDGIKKKMLVYPKWILLVHYGATICTTLTMVFVLFFISWYDPQLAFGDENIFLHIICPLAVLISFFMVESDYLIDRLDIFYGLSPFIIYSFVYLYFVVIAKSWEDHYMLNTFVPFYISFPLMYVLAYIIACLIRYIYNSLSKFREKKMKAIWDKDLDPVEIKIDIYSLGVHAGLHQSKQDVSIPYGILEEVSDKFDIKIEELVQAYTKGVIEGFKEKR